MESDEEEPSANRWTEFWTRVRKIEITTALNIIHQVGRRAPYVRTGSRKWKPLYSVLLPGGIVPGDGSRDDDATVDMGFHMQDVALLRGLGVTDAPCDSRDLSLEPGFFSFRDSCRRRFREQDGLPRTPDLHYLSFTPTKGIGPMEVLTVLSDEGRVLYTDALLSLDATYEQWTMCHNTVNSYQPMPCKSLAVHMLRKNGRVRTQDGIVPFADALGPQPRNPAALHALLAHPKADLIKKAFDLSEPTPEFVGEEDPSPLIDVWPGLGEHLPPHRKSCQLIRCERILVDGDVAECVFHVSDIYLAHTGDDDENHELRLVSNGLELDLNESQISDALKQYQRALGHLGRPITRHLVDIPISREVQGRLLSFSTPFECSSVLIRDLIVACGRSIELGATLKLSNLFKMLSSTPHPISRVGIISPPDNPL